ISPIRNARGAIIAYEVRAQVGSGPSAPKDRKRFPGDATPLEMQDWRIEALKRLGKGKSQPGTLSARVSIYIAEAKLSPANRKRRAQQLAFWCAQPAAEGAPVLTVDQVLAEAEAVKAGKRAIERGELLG